MKGNIERFRVKRPLSTLSTLPKTRPASSSSTRQRRAQSSRPDAGRRLLVGQAPQVASKGKPEDYAHNSKCQAANEGRQVEPKRRIADYMQEASPDDNRLSQSNETAREDKATPAWLVSWVEPAQGVVSFLAID